jgi:hypothetical protein
MSDESFFSQLENETRSRLTALEMLTNKAIEMQLEQFESILILTKICL